MMSRDDNATLRGSRRIAALYATIVLVVSLGLAGCAIQLVGQYDEQTVTAVTALLEKIERQLFKLERAFEAPGAADQTKYEDYADFYDEIKTDLSLIRARAQAIPKNELTVKQLDVLANQIRRFEDAHKQGRLNAAVVKISRETITQTIEAILAAEFAKKRG